MVINHDLYFHSSSRPYLPTYSTHTYLPTYLPPFQERPKIGFKGHGVPLYLDKQLYLAFIKLQADKHLGKSYAGLLCLVTGLHELGYLSEKQFLNHKKRYLVPLDKDPQQVMLEEVNEAQQRKQLNQMFGQVIQQWSLHPDSNWRQTWLAKAKQHGDIPNAVKLLAVVEEQKG